MKKGWVCLALVLTGCTQLDQLKSVTNSTNSMSDTTKQLSQTTDGMSATTTALYQNLRQGNSVQTREQALATMDVSKTQEEKILYAGIYMMAFEFQLWTGKGPDDEVRRESLFNDLFIQLDKDIRNYITSANLSLDPTSTDNNMMNLYALAATLHMINPMQQTLVANNPSIPSYTVLSLAEQALEDNVAINNGSKSIASLPLWENQALQNDGDLLYMIQLRANFIPALVVSKFTNVEYAGITTKAKDLGLGFTANFSDVGVVALNTYGDYMKEANANRDFLTSIGSSAQYNSRLNLLYKNMQLPWIEKGSTVSASQAKAQASSYVVDEIKEFKNALPKTSLMSCFL
jgi:hypothetical protein